MDDRKFEVRCSAKPEGELQVRTQSLSVSVGQSFIKDGAEEMWNSVLILCDRSDDGALTTKIILSHPDWDQSLQIAEIQSRSGTGDGAMGLHVDLARVKV